MMWSGCQITPQSPGPMWKLGRTIQRGYCQTDDLLLKDHARRFPALVNTPLTTATTTTPSGRFMLRPVHADMTVRLLEAAYNICHDWLYAALANSTVTAYWFTPDLAGHYGEVNHLIDELVIGLRRTAMEYRCQGVSDTANDCCWLDSLLIAGKEPRQGVDALVLLTKKEAHDYCFDALPPIRGQEDPPLAGPSG